MKFRKTFFAFVVAASVTIPAAKSYAIAPTLSQVYAYGAGLTAKEIETVGQTLGVSDEVQKTPVTGADIKRYINDDESDSSMISSTYVKRGEKGSGVVVDIKTPANITKITPVQYSNAAITAGVQDLTIHVAAPRPVTGESALTGVYKSLELMGTNLDTERMAVAQEELDTVSDIAQENSNNKDFSNKDFDQIIINIKNELNILQNNLTSGETINKAQVEKIVNDAINKANLKDLLSQDQVNRLINLFEKYVNTDAVKSGDVVNQLKDLTKDVSEKAAHLYKDAKDSGLLDRIFQFFADLFEAIADFFRSLFGK